MIKAQLLVCVHRCDCKVHLLAVCLRFALVAPSQLFGVASYRSQGLGSFAPLGLLQKILNSLCLLIVLNNNKKKKMKSWSHLAPNPPLINIRNIGNVKRNDETLAGPGVISKYCSHTTKVSQKNFMPPLLLKINLIIREFKRFLEFHHDSPDRNPLL